jgi:hypothetical protein
MGITIITNPNQSIENSPKKYIKTLTADANPTGVPIGSELWDAQADVTYITPDGVNWSEKKRAKYETLSYDPGLVTSGDLEAGTKTITRTAEASGAGNADYTCALTLPMTCTVNGAAKSLGVDELRVIITRLASRLSVTIDSDDGTHDLRCRVYVDSQDTSHRLFDSTCAATGINLSAQDILASTKEVIFNLLKDGSAHTFYFFFWTPGNHSPVISAAQVWECIGSCDTTYTYPVCLYINFAGQIEGTTWSGNILNAASAGYITIADSYLFLTSYPQYAVQSSLGASLVNSRWNSAAAVNPGIGFQVAAGTNAGYLSKLLLVLRSDV